MHEIDCFGLHCAYKEESSGLRAKNLFSLVAENGFDDFSAHGIASYFSFRHPILQYTMFNGISKYDAQPGSLIPSEVWKPIFSDHTLGENLFEKAIIAKVEEKLLRAIEKLAGSKKRIGVTLSGGLDSSLILSMLRSMYPDAEILTYSIGFYGDDEFEYSRDAAARFSTRHWEKVLTAEDFIGKDSIMKPLIMRKCAPLHPNEIALALAERQAKRDACDVVFCGEGADDIFGGYGRNLRMYLRYLPSQDYCEFLLSRYRYFKRDDVAGLIRDEYLLDDAQLLKGIFEEAECPADARNRMLYFIQRIHTRGLIERGMNALGFAGCAPAIPFIEPEMVEYANSLPFDLHVKWKDGFSDAHFMGMDPTIISEKYDTPKYLLKKVAEAYLPHHIIYRPKHGFPVPFELWMRDLKTFELSNAIFKTSDISRMTGWQKFMIINLDCFIKSFMPYRK